MASAGIALPFTTNAFQPKQTSVCPSSSAVSSPTSWKVFPPSQETCLSTLAAHVRTPTVSSLICKNGSSIAESWTAPLRRSCVRFPVTCPACARAVAEVTPEFTTILQDTGAKIVSLELSAGKVNAVPSTVVCPDEVPSAPGQVNVTVALVTSQPIPIPGPGLKTLTV